MRLTSFWKHSCPMNKKRPFDYSLYRNVGRSLMLTHCGRNLGKLRVKLECEFSCNDTTSLICLQPKLPAKHRDMLWTNNVCLYYFYLLGNYIFVWNYVFYDIKTVKVEPSYWNGLLGGIWNHISIHTEAIKGDPMHCVKPLCGNVAMWNKMDAVPGYLDIEAHLNIPHQSTVFENKFVATT